MSELKPGYKASAEQFSPRELVELGVLAETYGMDSTAVSDHFQPWRVTGGHAPFALPWMTAVGERTQRITLGTSVLIPTFRYNPAVIRAGVRDDGLPIPRPSVPGRGDRRGAQRHRDWLPVRGQSTKDASHGCAKRCA